MILIEHKTRKGRSYFLNTEGIFLAQECITCKNIKLASEFNKCNKVFGVQTVCKTCTKDYKTKYQKTDRCKELAKKNATKYKDRINLYHKKWKVANPEKVKVSSATYRAKNRNKLNEVSRKWTSDNKEKRAEISSKSSKRHRASKNEYRKKWRKVNPEKNIRTDRRLDPNLGHVKYFLKEINKTKFSIRSLNKNKSASEHLTLDHIIPLVHKDVCGLNCPENMQILSRSENAFKSNKWDGTIHNNSWMLDYLKSREATDE